MIVAKLLALLNELFAQEVILGVQFVIRAESNAELFTSLVHSLVLCQLDDNDSDAIGQ